EDHDELDGDRDRRPHGRGEARRARAERRGPPGVEDPADVRWQGDREEDRDRAVGHPAHRGDGAAARGARPADQDARQGRRDRRAHGGQGDPMTDKVIISCALTGAVTTKQLCPAIPYTPVAIADEAKRAYDAGAAIVHIHARTDAGAPSWDPQTFAAIKAEIEKRCPVLINWSTGGAGPMKDRVEHLKTRPHIAALNMGSMNYAKWRPRKQSFAFNFVFANSFDDIIASARAIREAGAKPEMECFDTGHVSSHTVPED